MDPLSAALLALLIVSMCYTFLRFNSQLSESKERQLETKRDIKEMEVRMTKLETTDQLHEEVMSDGGSLDTDGQAGQLDREFE